MTQRHAGGRTLFNNSASVQFGQVSAIPSSFFPVDSAIQMRDDDSKLTISVMNDRSQGGTADLTEPGTIELM
jgi:hypothetical protein